jgi:hypothetical protein
VANFAPFYCLFPSFFRRGEFFANFLELLNLFASEQKILFLPSLASGVPAVTGFSTVADFLLILRFLLLLTSLLL